MWNQLVDVTKLRWRFQNMRYQRMYKIKMADPAGTKRLPQNRPVVPSPSRSVPANSGSQRMAREMRKLRLLQRICMCHLASQRLADTDAWCILSLLYRIRGFCSTPLPPPLDIVQILQHTLVKHLLNTLGLRSMPEAAGILGNVFTWMWDVSRLWECRHAASEL